MNSYTWPPMNSDPSRAVVSSHRRLLRMSPRWRAERASTMVSELISSTNELTEVKGMSKMSPGAGPAANRLR